MGADSMLTDRRTNIHDEANVPFSQLFCEQALKLCIFPHRMFMRFVWFRQRTALISYGGFVYH